MIRIPQELLDDSVIGVHDLLAGRRLAPLATPKLSEVAAKHLPALAPAVREDLVEAARDAIQAADPTGLAAPYEEEAAELVSYIVDALGEGAGP